MATLSRSDFAREAVVSKQAISKAVRRGALVVSDVTNRLDTEAEPNSRYLRIHREGYDSRARDMRTHRGPGQSYVATERALAERSSTRSRPEPALSGSGGGLDPDLSAWLDRELAEARKREPLFSDEELASALNRLDASMSPIDEQFLHKIDGLARAIAEVKAAIEALGDRLLGFDEIAGSVDDRLNETVKQFEQRLAAIVLPASPMPRTPGPGPVKADGLQPPQGWPVRAPSPPAAPAAGYVPPAVAPSRFEQVEGKLDRVLTALEEEGEESRAALARVETAIAAHGEREPATAVRTETSLLALERQGRDMLSATERVGRHVAELIRVLVKHSA